MYDFIWQEMAEKMVRNHPHIFSDYQRNGLIEDLASAMKDAWGKDRVADTWTIDDVQDWAMDQYGVDIPDEDARVILHNVLNKMDAETGINWYVFDWPIQAWIEKNSPELLDDEGDHDDSDY